MINQGLKLYTKQLCQSVGDSAELSINLNKENANLIIAFPLLKTVGNSGIELSLLYNYQNRNELGYFGSGMRLNFFAKVTEINGGYALHNADGSIDYFYENDDYKNQELHSSLRKIIDDEYGLVYHYELRDKQDNVQKWERLNTEYYSKLVTSTEEITIDFLNSIKTIKNGKGDMIKFYLQNGKINKIEYSYEGAILYLVSLGYDASGNLETITYGKENIILHKTEMKFSSNQIQVKDMISNQEIACYLSNGLVSSLVESYKEDDLREKKTIIEYEEGKTKVINYRNKESYIFFDKKNMPLYEMDNEGNAIQTRFDQKTKALLFQSKLVSVKGESHNLFGAANMIEKTGISIKDISCTDSVFQPYFGSTIKEFRGTGSLIYEIPTNVLATDVFTAIVWVKQLTSYTKDSYVRVSLSAGKTVNKIFDKEIKDDHFDFMVLGLSCPYSYSSLQLRFEFKGNAAIAVGNIQIYKKNFGAFYEYDASGNSIGYSTGTGSTIANYNSNNLVSSFLTENSTLYQMEYNVYRQLKKTKTAYGVVLEKEYDLINHQLKKEHLSNEAKTKQLELQKTYSVDGRFIVEEQNTLQQKTKYTYDNYGKIKKVTDALNSILEYEYYDNELLKEMKLNNASQASYTYDSQKRIHTITISNGCKYEFNYTIYNDIQDIKINNTLLYSFEYDTLGRVVKQIYGTSKKAFEFEYEEELLQKIYYNDGKNKHLRYQYIYNSKKQVEKILDKDGIILKAFIYDADDFVIKTFNSEHEVEHNPDNLGSINTRKRIVENQELVESFDSINRSKGSNPESLMDYFQGQEKWFGGLFLEDDKIKNNKLAVSPVHHNGTISEFTVHKDGIIPYISISGYKELSYVLPQRSVGTIKYSGCIAFWFKPKNVNNRQTLFYARGNSGDAYVYAYVMNRKVTVEVMDSKGNKYSNLIVSKNLISENQWNFFGLNWMSRNDGVGYKDVCEFALTINGSTDTYKKENPSIVLDLETNPIYNIGHYYYGSGREYLSADIACLILGNNTYITYDEMNTFYRVTKDYIIDNQLKDDDTVSVDFSLSQIYTTDQEILSSFEIYPLQNHVKSIHGIEPIAFNLRSVTAFDKDRTFNYNSIIKRYAYVADGAVLKYNFKQSTTGTIFMRAYTDVTSEKQYFLEGKDLDGSILGLYRNKNQKLCIQWQDTTIETSFIFPNNTWHSIALSFDTSSHKVRVYFDGAVFEHVVTTGTYKELIFSIGRKTDSNGNTSNLGLNENFCPLNGQMEMLSTQASYCNKEVLDKLREELKSITKVQLYDELGMLQKTELHKAGTKILSNCIEYKKRQIDENQALSYYVGHEEQLREIKNQETFIFEKHHVYAMDGEDLYYIRLEPDIRFTNISWEIADYLYEEYTLEQKKIYNRINEGFCFAEDRAFKNVFGASLYILDLGQTLEESPYLSPLVSKETLQTGASILTTRSYKTDALGRVTEINDPVFGSHTYTYDNRGFLIKEDNTSYTYDGNGNMIWNGRYALEYDSVIKDRLIFAEGYDIEYYTDGNMLNWKDKDLVFEGRRLMQCDSTEYTYDEEGLRLTKTVNGKKTKYYYDDDQLITELNPNYRLDFLYDENGILYGFIKDNQNKYFYVRDCLQNILGVIDSSGNLVVKYKCDAWGNHSACNPDGRVNNSETFIGNINPFRYKGYYYDTDTEMYYCKSRYYVPELCRFISPDSIEYLDPSNINGMNLYAYCNNDPVNYVDPTGHFPWLILAAILLFTPVGGTALQVATSVASYAGMAVASIFNEDIRNDMNAIGWNPFNTDTSATLNSSTVSFYKGVPVFRMAVGCRSGSFGAIFLEQNSNVDVLRHERGHNWQLMMMGIANYGLMIGLPSWQGWSKRNYYERPWEITADILGGVEGRPHLQSDINRGYWYLAVSSLFGPFGYFFLLGEY